MRFTEPSMGEQRIITRFLWLPKTFKISSGQKQTRWLERASWRQAYYGPLWLDSGFWDDTASAPDQEKYTMRGNEPEVRAAIASARRPPSDDLPTNGGNLTNGGARKGNE